MTIYAVFATGTFWGAFEGTDEAEATQAAANEHGTDGNTEGMIAKPLAAYLDEVREGCASNGADFIALVREFFNSREADVSDDGSDIWIADPQNGHWIDAKQKTDLLAWIECQ